MLKKMIIVLMIAGLAAPCFALKEDPKTNKKDTSVVTAVVDILKTIFW